MLSSYNISVERLKRAIQGKGLMVEKRVKSDVVAPGVPAKGTVRDYWETICVVLIFVLFARTWVFQNSNIPSGSMKDTLLVGDRVLVNYFIYGPALFSWERALLPIREPSQKDIVVFKYPGKPDVPFIKRVIAKGGDVVQVVRDRAYVNGKALDEPYANIPDYMRQGATDPPPLPPSESIPVLPDYLTQPEAFAVMTQPGRVDVSLKEMQEGETLGREDFGPYRIPAGHLFVMGDNRASSEDSRYWGALDEKMVLGRAWIVWWSFKEGDYDYMKSSPGDIAKKLGDKVIHFFSKTRWNRILERPK